MGIAHTTIGFEDTVLTGTVTIDFDKLMDDHFAQFVLQLGELQLWIGTHLDSPSAPNRTGVYWIQVPGRQEAAAPFDVSDPKELELEFSIAASGYHIQRQLSHTPLMKPACDFPSPHETHTVEREAIDTWTTELEDGTIEVQFGELSASITNGQPPPGYDPTDPENPAYAEITPTSHISLDFQACYTQHDGSYDSARVSLALNNVPLIFDEVYAEKPPVVMRGDGSTLFWGSTGVSEVKDISIAAHVAPPHIVDWSQYGLCNWGETAHNDEYDSVLVWGGFTKTTAIDGIVWPLREETDAGGTGEFDWGDPIPVRLGDLRALGTYVQRVNPYTPLKSNAPEFWYGPWVSLRVDTRSHQKHNLYPKPLSEHPLRLPIGIPHLLNPMPDVDPHFPLTVTRTDVVVDVPDGLDGRPSAWESADFELTGGDVGSTGVVEFDVPIDGGVLSRTLKSNWLPRCSALIEYGGATGNWSVFPAGYMVHRANYMRELYDEWDWDDIEEKTGYVEDDEDVTYFSSHRYLLIEIEGPMAADATELQVDLTYRVETVNDDHTLDLTGPSGVRGVSCSLGPPRVASYTGYYTASKKAITIDLAEPFGALLDLRHVESISITFADIHAGEWELSNVALVHDDNIPEALVTMHEARHGYVSGGVRGVVNGVYPLSLVTSGNFQTYGGQEPLVELINWNWTVTPQLTLDGSTAWSLEEFVDILTAACEGWEWELPDNWGNMVTDAFDNRLTVGRSFDVAERQAYEPATGYPARLGAQRWQTAPRLVYRPHGVVCVQGGIHGLTDTRNGSGGVVAYGGGEIALQTDAHGYFQIGADIVREYPTPWEYTVGGQKFSRLYERQYRSALYDIFPRCRQPHLALDDSGRVWLAANDGKGNIRVYWRPSPQQPWERCTDAFISRDHAHPCITPMHDGRLMVSATDSTGVVDIVVSSNDGKNWGTLE